MSVISEVSLMLSRYKYWKQSPTAVFFSTTLHLRTERSLNLLGNAILLQRYDNESDQDNGIKPHER